MKNLCNSLLLMLAFMLPITASGIPQDYDNYEFAVDGIYYKIVNNAAWVTYKRYQNSYYYSDYRGEVIIPNTVTYNDTTYPVTRIDHYAFYGCQAMTGITIPESITSIGGAFDHESKITRVTINNLESWCNISFYLFNPLCIAQHLYLNDTEVTDLTIPESVTTIKKYAFEGCTGLTSVTFHNSVTEIGEQAFEGCTGLNKVICLATTPPNLANRNVFDNTTYSNATLLVPIGCTTDYLSSDWRYFSHIEGIDSRFEKDGIYYYITGANTVTMTCYNYGDGSYSGDITIPASVTHGGSTYNVTVIDDRTFYLNSELTSVTIPNTVTAIGEQAFEGCTKLTSIDIPDLVTEISSRSFYDCTGLTSVAIGQSVKTIGQDAFKNTSSIETVTCKATTPPSWYSMDMFTNNVYNHAPLHVPEGCERAYKADPYWGQFLTIIGDVSDENPSDDANYLKCDVNGDGEVTIADVNMVIDAILNH